MPEHKMACAHKCLNAALGLLRNPHGFLSPLWLHRRHCSSHRAAHRAHLMLAVSIGDGAERALAGCSAEPGPCGAAGQVPQATEEATRHVGASLPMHTSALVLLSDLLGTPGTTVDMRVWTATAIWARRGLRGLWLSTEHGLRASTSVGHSGLLWLLSETSSQCQLSTVLTAP